MFLILLEAAIFLGGFAAMLLYATVVATKSPLIAFLLALGGTLRWRPPCTKTIARHERKMYQQLRDNVLQALQEARTRRAVRTAQVAWRKYTVHAYLHGQAQPLHTYLHGPGARYIHTYTAGKNDRVPRSGTLAVGLADGG